jgi:hypothetical protein
MNSLSVFVRFRAPFIRGIVGPEVTKPAALVSQSLLLNVFFFAVHELLLGKTVSNSTL